MSRCHLVLVCLFATCSWLVSLTWSAAAECPEDDRPSTPAWTLPDAFLPAEGKGGDLGWPEVRAECRPGAYWWWPGNAVTKADLTWNLETYRAAGWGNLGVIGIYGVRGAEDRFINIFSPKWCAMYNHASAEAKRLGMNIDLTPSSGWRMGGPHVTPQYAEQSFAVEQGRIVAKTRTDRVKHAGPGGQGLAINPYSKAAVQFHLDWVGRRLADGIATPPRAFYYDSFENSGNWCPEFLQTFRQLRGYSLERHAEALAARGAAEHSQRVLCDYRETLSDLLIGRAEQIVAWGQQRGSGLRMQAHGAPANLLDMYAVAEIPETEVFGASYFDIPGYRRDPKWVRPDRQSDLVNRFASSAAHVAGRKVVISESFTWLRNHYHTALSHIKAESDKLLLNGINCIYYHGICFAPKKTTWPGWLFYASTQANARNSIFRDVPALNAYITRCQSVLQSGTPHNDVLLYWPIYDLWMRGGSGEQRFSVHHPEWIEKTACGAAGRWMIERGYTFDFVSDRQLLRTRWAGNSLRTEGGTQYATILVPAARIMQGDTTRHLLDLASAGATVLVWKGLPQDVAGWKDHAARKQRLASLLDRLSLSASGVAKVGNGNVIVGDDLGQLLDLARIAREPLVDRGLTFIRRRGPASVTYFIANHSAEPIRAWVAFASPCRSAVLMNPMTAHTGVALVRTTGGQAEVYLQMQPGETRVLRAFASKVIDGPRWPIREPSGKPVTVQGTWDIEFLEGGPVLPKGPSASATQVAHQTSATASLQRNESTRGHFQLSSLKSWTELGNKEANRFAGAARYTITVRVPDTHASGWVLDLGDVRESARVWVNGHPAGIVVAQPFRVDLTGLLTAGDNELAIEVTNLSANRIRDLDRRGIDWKKFYDINLVDHTYKPLDASHWDLEPSGLLGPVTLYPLRLRPYGATP